MGGHREAATAVELTVLGSGSAGNAALLGTPSTRILIDAGISRRKLRQRLEESGHECDSLSAILLTHEHSDHAGHAGKIAAQFGCPVYLSHGTWAALEENEWFERRECFRPGDRFRIGDVEVAPFQVPHDAKEPVGFRFEAAGVRLAYALDLGFLTTLVKESLRGCDGIVLEANYEDELLRRGPYPWDIKQRIWGRNGHLSNEALKHFVENELDGAVRHLVLAHLSENNNSPELARMAAEEGLAKRRQNGRGNGAADPEIYVTERNAALPTLSF